MFLGDSGTELEAEYLRSGRIFRSRKKRKNVTRSGSCSTTKGECYDLTLNVDKGSFDKYEEYQSISEEEKKNQKLQTESTSTIPLQPHTHRRR